jgi:hypothetical protein
MHAITMYNSMISQHVNVGQVETVCFVITIEDLLTKPHIPNCTHGVVYQQSLVEMDKRQQILPQLLTKFIPPFWIVFQVSCHYA